MKELLSILPETYVDSLDCTENTHLLNKPLFNN